MAKIIEAKAIITAEDKTGAVFDKLAKKLDQIAKNKQTATTVDSIAKSLQNAKTQMAAIERFNTQRGLFGDSRARFRAQQEAVESAARAMKTGLGPAKELDAQYRRAQASVTSAARAFENQKTALLSAKRAVESFGMPISKVVAEQQRLKSAVESANAALMRQGSPRQSHIWSPHGALGAAAATAAGYGSAHAIAHGIKETVLAGAHYQHEVTALKNAGRTPAEMAEIEHASRATVASIPTSTFTDNLKVINETTGAFGTLHHAIENLPFMQKSAAVLHAAGGTQDSAGEMGNKLARFFEMRGTAGDTPVFQKEAGEMIRAMAFSKGKFNPSEMLLFGQQATPGTIGNYDLRFLSKIAPSLATEFGGDRAGTAANAFRNVIMGKVNDRKQAEAWLDLGLLDPKLTTMKSGHAVGWKAGAIKGTNLFLTDPLRAMEEIVIPAMQKKGIDVDDKLAVTKQLGTMYRNSMANRFAEALTQARSRKRLHNDEANINQAGDLDTIYNRNIQEDPTAAISGLTSSLDNLMTAVSSPAMQTAASTITAIAGSLNNFANVLKDHPNMAMAGGAAVAGGALAGAGWLTYQLANGFGLATSAAALDGSAAALSAAAAALSGGSVAGKAVPAAAAGAGWLSTMGSFLYPGTIAAAAGVGLYGMYQATTPYEGMNSGERMSAWRGGSMRDVYRRSFNDDRDRLGISPLDGSDDWKPYGQTPWPSGGNPAAPLSVEGTVTGTMEGRFTVEAGSELLRVVDSVRNISSQLQGQIGANGPGSNGRSSPDATAGAHGTPGGP